MAKEELEDIIEYEDYEADYIEEPEELSDNDKVVQNSKGQVKFKSVNHSKRAEANEVETDGEIATYANYALEYFGYRCALSGEKLVIFVKPVEREGNARVTTNLSAEHIVALTTGGNDIIPNIVPTVLQYNIQKNGYYILDWWPKAKDINGNSIYSPEKLLKLVNYMLKSLQARKDLGIKKQPREYRKRLLTPNKIDEFLMQEEIAKELLSDTITATTELEDGKNILTQIPQQEGEIPSLAKQKAKETKITEAMFLTDALEVLEKEEKIPQEITEKLQNMYKEVEGEIPFEIEVRKNILSVLEQMGIENNKYTVANDLLISTIILENIKLFHTPIEIEGYINKYLISHMDRLKTILNKEQIIKVISNRPDILYDVNVFKNLEFWSKYNFSIFEELLNREENAIEETLRICQILNSSGVDLTKIQITNTNNKKTIKIKLKDLQQDGINISNIIIENGLNPEFELGQRISRLRSTYNDKEDKFMTESERKMAESLGILENNRDSSIEETLKICQILYDNGINLSKIQIRKNREFILLKDILIDGVDIIKTIEENGLDESFPFGQRVSQLRQSYNGKGTCIISNEGKKIAEDIGLIDINKETSVAETLRVCEILYNNGVDLSMLNVTKTVEGKTERIMLLDLEHQGVNIGKIIDENGLDEYFPFGQKVIELRRAYNSKNSYIITNEEKGLAEKIGILERKKESAIATTLRICQILADNGVDLTNLQPYKRVNERKSRGILLNEIEQKGIDIKKIIKENGLEGTFKFGRRVEQLRQSYNGKGKCVISEEEKKIAEKLGILDKKESVIDETLKICQILANNGVHFESIELSKMIDGKRYDILLNEIEQKGIDIIKIIEENNLSGDFPFGQRVGYLRSAYNGTVNCKITGDERRTAEDLRLIRTEQETSIAETLRICQVLYDNGVDLFNLTLSKTTNGKTEGIKLTDIKQEGIDILKIVSDNGLNPDFELGRRISSVRGSYNGAQKLLITEEEKKLAQRLGLIKEYRETSVAETLRICRILSDNGIDLSKIQLSVKVNGKYKEILLNEIEQEGIDIIKIIEENNLSGDFPLGKRVKRVRGAYNGTDANPITETEKEEAEKLEILGKKRGNKTKIKSVINQNRENLSSALESGVELETEILMAEKITERSASDGRGQ